MSASQFWQRFKGLLVAVVALAGVVGLLAGALHLHTLRTHGTVPSSAPAGLRYHLVEGQAGSPYPYTPDVLHIPAGRTVTLRLTDYLGGCGLVTVFPGLAPGGGDARARVPVGTTGTVQLRAQKAGTYPFHCSENMYFGTIIAQ